jgi:hypothetical protein
MPSFFAICTLVSVGPQPDNLPDQVQRLEHPSRHILHQAADQSVLLRHRYDDGRYLGEPEGLECLDPPLAADQVIAWFIAFLFRAEANLDWFLEAEIPDALNDLSELLLIPVPGIQDAYLVNGY